METPIHRNLLTEADKTAINRSLDAGLSIVEVGAVLNILPNTISKFRSRLAQVERLGAPTVLPRSKIQGRYGVLIKNIVNGNSKLSLPKIRRKIIEMAPEGSWYN
jgi:transposase